MLKVLSLLAFASLLVGCGAQSMSDADLAAHRVGPYPENYQEIIKTYITSVLHQSTDIQYVFSPAAPGKLWGGETNGGWVYGYLVDVDVNSKTDLGTYSGYQKWQFIIANGAVKFVVPPGGFHGIIK